MVQNLTTKMVRGATWTGFSQLLVQGIGFATIIVLARILLPDDFGIIAMAAIVLNIALRVIDAGFSEAIVQRKDQTDSHLSTAFWFIASTGAGVCLITVAASTWVGRFFDNEQVGPVLAVSSITFFLIAMGAVHGALLKKRFQFFKSGLADIFEVTGHCVVAVSLALAGFGLWSIVLGNLAGCMTLTISRWCMSGWRPRFHFNKQRFKELWRFGINITGTRLINTLGNKTIDSLVVGKFLSVASLGFYAMALRGASLTADILWFVMNRVAVPTFSLLQDTSERLKRGFIKSVNFTSLVGFPIFVGLALVAREFVSIFFGDKWLPCVLPMQILCISAAIGTMYSGVTYAFVGIGRPDINLKLTTVQILLLIPLILIGVRFEAIGVAVVVLSVNIVIWLSNLIIARRVLGIKILDYFAAQRSAALAVLVMALVLFPIHQFLLSQVNIPDIWSLAGLVTLGAIVYISVLKITKNNALNEITKVLQDMMKSSLGFISVKKKTVSG